MASSQYPNHIFKQIYPISPFLDFYKLDSCRYFHVLGEMQDYFEYAQTSARSNRLCILQETEPLTGGGFGTISFFY